MTAFITGESLPLPNPPWQEERHPTVTRAFQHARLLYAVTFGWFTNGPGETNTVYTSYAQKFRSRPWIPGREVNVGTKEHVHIVPDAHAKLWELFDNLELAMQYGEAAISGPVATMLGYRTMLGRDLRDGDHLEACVLTPLEARRCFDKDGWEWLLTCGIQINPEESS